MKNLKFIHSVKTNKFLAILPTFGNPFSAYYQGPHRVAEVRQNNNHLVESPDRKTAHQVVYINRLKEYCSRNSEEEAESLLCTVSEPAGKLPCERG